MHPMLNIAVRAARNAGKVIIRSFEQLDKVEVESAGDTSLTMGALLDRDRFEEENAAVLAEGGEPATAHVMIAGITKTALHTDSWLSAASFRRTTQVLTDAATKGDIDYLRGLKENVIIGRLIPAGTGFQKGKAFGYEMPGFVEKEVEPGGVGKDGPVGDVVLSLLSKEAVGNKEEPSVNDEDSTGCCCGCSATPKRPTGASLDPRGCVKDGGETDGNGDENNGPRPK